MTKSETERMRKLIHVGGTSSTRQTLCYPIPLGPYIAQLVLPRDLTQPECDRLCALLRSLVGPQIHEDELPESMTDEQFAAWFAVSYIPDGVGCRMGPAV